MAPGVTQKDCTPKGHSPGSDRWFGKFEMRREGLGASAFDPSPGKRIDAYD